MDRIARTSVRPATGPRRRRLIVTLLLGGLALVLLASAPAAGAGPRQIIFDLFASPSWTSSVAGPGAADDSATDVVLPAGEAVFVAGTLSNAAGNPDISLTKYLGSVKQWTKSYDGPAHSSDISGRMALSPDGRAVYICGGSLNAAGTSDFVVIKRATKSGRLLWAKRYDGPAHQSDWSSAIGVDGDGNVIVGGASENAADLDWAVVSWNAAGKKRWSWRYDGSGHDADVLYDLLVNRDGTAYLTGMSVTAGPAQAAANARLTSAGKKMWLKTYKGPEDLGGGTISLTPRPGGGVYACGVSLSAVTGTDGMVLRYSPKGKRTVFAIDSGPGGTSSQVLLDVVVTTTRDVIAVGYSTNAGDDDQHAVLYRPNGSVIANITVPAAWAGRFSAVAADALGGYYITGTEQVAAGDVKISTWRGSTLFNGGGWHSIWGPAVSIDNAPEAVGVRGTTAYVVGEYLSAGPTGIDQVLLAYTY